MINNSLLIPGFDVDDLETRCLSFSHPYERKFLKSSESSMDEIKNRHRVSKSSTSNPGVINELLIIFYLCLFRKNLGCWNFSKRVTHLP